MNLEIQIQTIFVSVILGMFSSLVFNVFYRLLYSKYIITKILSNLIYSLTIFTLFFYVLFIVNNGVVHIYFILLFIIGFIIGNLNLKKIRKYIKKSN